MKRRPNGFAGQSGVRRAEIDRALAAIARAGRTRRRLHVVAPDGRGEDTPRLLRDTLDSLGGVFVLFGRYLASRRDLLSSRFAAALEALPDTAPPLDAALVREAIARRLGPAAREFTWFDDLPTESTIAWQGHRARLRDGRPVIVRVTRPSLMGDLEHLDLLERLGDLLSPGECSSAAYRAALDDFGDEFRDALDLRAEQDGLEQLAEDARHFDGIGAPCLHRALSCDSVLTREPVAPFTVAELIGRAASPDARDELARLIARVWLQQASLGRVFPAALTPATIEAFGRGRIVFSAGSFHSIGPADQTWLREYLLHALSDPDRACIAFVRLMRGDRRAADEQALQRQFRQTVAFRDSDWCRSAEDERVEHHLWVQWRSAAAAGFIPLPQMAAFYRGFTELSRVVRAVSPGDDPIRHALTALRSAETHRDVVTSIDPNEFCRVAGEYMQLALALPERMDDLLRRMSDGPARLRIGVAADTSRDRHSLTLLFVIVLLCSATVLLSAGGGGVTTGMLLKAVLLAGLTTAVAMIVEAWK